jgi:hypothetical protein
MNTPQLLNEVASELIGRGLPADYAARAAAELADHHGDLMHELQATGSSESQAATEAARRLGDTRALVKKTVREYQRRYWCARWPLLSFLFGPFALLIGTSLAINLFALCIVGPLHWLGIASWNADGILSPGERFQIYVLQAIHLFIAPAIVMLILSWRARRAAISGIWVALSASLLTLLLVTIRCGIPHPIPTMFNLDGTTLPADRYLWTMSLPGSWSELATWVSWTHAQCLVPFLVVAAMTIRSGQLSRRNSRLFASC